MVFSDQDLGPEPPPPPSSDEDSGRRAHLKVVK
jgi:hypothetical protein